MRREGRIPHQRYVIESVGVYEKGEVPPHLSWLPKTQEGGAVEYEVKNRVELKGSNHSKCNRPHDLLTTGKNERPFDKALAKRKGAKHKRWHIGASKIANITYSNTTLAESDFSDASIGLVESEGKYDEDDSSKFYRPQRPLQLTLPILPASYANSSTRPYGRKSKAFRKTYNYGLYSSGFRTYEDACQELSAVLRPSQNLGKNPYGEGMQSGFDLSDAELDSEGSQPSQGADAAYESDSEESILFPSLASTPSASMSVVSFSEINDSAPQLPSLEEEVGDFEYNGEGESLQSSKDSHGDWEILSDMDSWDEIFEHSDLIPADLY